MRALVYHGPGQKAWEEVTDAEICDEADAVVRVDATTICGTDLHILAGDVPGVHPGMILGHEAVGVIAEIGDDVRRLRVGDRVLVSCISPCGTCRFCREGRYGQCEAMGGWMLGHKMHGTQAEYVRVPDAENSLYPIPDGVSDEDALMLADVLPTGYEVGVLNGGVRPGDVVAVVGAGPVGLAAVTCARLFSPSHVIAIDHSDARLKKAKEFGADFTVNNAHDDPAAVIRNLTGRLGADVTIEAVGSPETFELAVKLARPGGRVANIGLHGKPVLLHLEEQWARDITITTGLVDASSTPVLMRLVENGQLDAARFITHHFSLDDMEQAYDVFGDPASGALKVVLTRSREEGQDAESQDEEGQDEEGQDEEGQNEEGNVW
jgi:alcohol dehydrogenase